MSFPQFLSKAVTIMKPVDEIANFFSNSQIIRSLLNNTESVQEKSGVFIIKQIYDPENTVSCKVTVVSGREILWNLESRTVAAKVTIRINDAPLGKGAEVWMDVDGRTGTLFSDNPAHFITEQLRISKQILEAGDLPISSCQPQDRKDLHV